MWIGSAADYPYRVGVPVKVGFRSLHFHREGEREAEREVERGRERGRERQSERGERETQREGAERAR